MNGKRTNLRPQSIHLIRFALLTSFFTTALAFGQGLDQGPSAESFLQNNAFGGASQMQRGAQMTPGANQQQRMQMGTPQESSEEKGMEEEGLYPKFARPEHMARPQPQPPNLFQVFIQKTTGRLLPIYGLDFFNRRNSFREQQSAPVPSDYVIGPGDEIILKIYGGTVNFDQRTIVDRDGMIALPKVGPVSVAGVKMSDLEKHLKSRISKVLSHFNLFVTMGQLRGIEIYLVGQARHPGKYVVGGLSTVISALFASGGPSNNGSLRAVQLVRNGKVVATVDLYDFLSKGDTSKDKRLLSGDVINIPPVGPSVALKGTLPVAAIFELSPAPASTSLRDLLPLAGGVRNQMSPDQVTLERMDAEKQKPLTAQKISLTEEGLNTPLKDGDILTFFPIKAAFENAVTLRILDEDPVRVPVNSDTRVKDILPSREFFMTRQYFLRRFGVTCVPDPTPNSSFDPNFMGPPNGMMNHRGSQGGGSNQENRDVATGPSPRPSIMMPPNPDGPFKCYQSTNNYAVPGEKGSAETDLSRIRRSNVVDQVNWEQAIIERPNLKELTTEVIPFNLGKAIEGDEASNLRLQPGDTITVFSQRDLAIPVERQTQIVRIQGEVNAPGIYQIKPGETLESLIARSGGFTKDAYIYGTVLSRLSVKARQAENLEVVIRRLEAQAAAQSSKTIARATESAEMTQATALNAQYAANTRAQIDRLKAMVPNGRIALEIDPKEPKLPLFRLEDGDEITIPTEPGFVSVVGAVLNENVLIFHAGRRVSNYLDIAGLAENAESDEIFVVRADGSIEPPSAEGARVYPGDTIVVPEKFYKESGYSIFMKGLKDWTQVFFQLGLGAAAIHTLNK